MLTLARSSNRLSCSWCAQVFAFGRNNHGQLGLGSTVDATVPRALGQGGLRGKRVTQLAAGFYHTICLTGAPSARFTVDCRILEHY